MKVSTIFRHIGGKEAFSVEIDTLKFVQDEFFVSLQVQDQGLYLTRKNIFRPSDLVPPFCVFGWDRKPMPLCCGLDIVTNLGLMFDFPNDLKEKWWKWVEERTFRPAFGIIPSRINEIGQKLPLYLNGYYDWLESKGTPWGNPIKNINYPNHILTPYLFFPQKWIDQVIKPSFGYFDKS